MKQNLKKSKAFNKKRTPSGKGEGKIKSKIISETGFLTRPPRLEGKIHKLSIKKAK